MLWVVPLCGVTAGGGENKGVGAKGPRAAELSIANRRHRCGVPGLGLIAQPAKRLKLDTQPWGLKTAHVISWP